MNFIEELESVFYQNASRETAIPMENYMKNNFPFYGIKNEKRKTLLKPIKAKHSEEIQQNLRKIIQSLFEKPEREFHYCAMEILHKEIKKKFLAEDIDWIEKLITTQSWWDSVDFLAKNILGGYLLHFPENTLQIINTFSDSDNIWLNRSAIIFQLGYKEKTNTAILFEQCIKHSESKEFFIQKAIGWALREYGKTEPEKVRAFVSKTVLKPLSKREALKNL
jgi:3-methyladenine DNA glycosylase AlkD